jgi:hypothetical protein
VRQQPISQTTWLKVTPHCNHLVANLSSDKHLMSQLFTLEQPIILYAGREQFLVIYNLMLTLRWLFQQCLSAQHMGLPVTPFFVNPL